MPSQQESTLAQINLRDLASVLRMVVALENNLTYNNVDPQAPDLDGLNDSERVIVSWILHTIRLNPDHPLLLMTVVRLINAMHDPAGELEFTTLAGELQRLGNNAVLEDPRTNYYQYAVALAGNRRPTPTGSQHMQYLRQTFSGAFLALNAPSAVQTPVAALLQLPVDALTLNCTSTRLRSQGNASSSTAATTPIQATSSASAFDATQATTPANFRSTTRESTRAGAAAPVIHSTAVTQAIGSQASQAGDQSAKAIDLRHGAPIVLDLETGLEVFRCVRCRGMKPISDFPGYSNHKKGYPRSCNRCYAYKKHKKPKQEKKESDSEDNIFHIPSHEPGTKRRRDPSDDEGEDDRHRGDGAGNRMMSGSRDRGIAV